MQVFKYTRFLKNLQLFLVSVSISVSKLVSSSVERLQAVAVRYISLLEVHKQLRHCHSACPHYSQCQLNAVRPISSPHFTSESTLTIPDSLVYITELTLVQGS
jgi:hypothetical protein